MAALTISCGVIEASLGVNGRNYGTRIVVFLRHDCTARQTASALGVSEVFSHFEASGVQIWTCHGQAADLDYHCHLNQLNDTEPQRGQ